MGDEERTAVSGGCEQSGEEWILMYRQGLGKRRIAELCSTQLNRVSRRINQEIQRDGGLEAAHLANQPVVVVIDPARIPWMSLIGLAETARAPERGVDFMG